LGPQGAEAFGLLDAFPAPASIIHAYEYTPANVRRFPRRHFVCPVIDLFGSTELGYLYYSDRDGRYWPYLDRMSVELLPVAPGSTIHQLIVTSVRNPYMPIVRYRSGDCVRTLNGTPDPAAITQFRGRQKELLSTPNGPVAQSDLDRHIADASPRIFLHQLHLHGDATLLYTTFTGEPVGATEGAALRQRIGELTGRHCRIEHRTHIPVGRSGTYSWLATQGA
jgi:phenylacetate-CoA ligase